MTTALDLTLTEVEPTDRALLRAVWDVRAGCAHDLAQRFGDGHWARVTSLRQLKQVVEQKHVYAVRRGEQVLATFTLSEAGAPFLHPRLFRDPHANATYLTALAVLPECQGQGIGRWCMEQAELLARDWGCRAVRFDAYDHEAGAGPFYDRGGYTRRGRLNVRGVALILYERAW